jgi:hypothetical protein
MGQRYGSVDLRIRIHTTISWIRNTLVPGVLAAGQEDGQAFLLGQDRLQLPLPASEHQVFGPSSVRQLGENRLSQVHSSLFVAELQIRNQSGSRALMTKHF